MSETINWNIVGRLLILGIGVVLWGYAALKYTKELDGVENAGLYRFALFLVALRGWSYFWFDLCNIFPL